AVPDRPRRVALYEDAGRVGRCGLVRAAAGQPAHRLRYPAGGLLQAAAVGVLSQQLEHATHDLLQLVRRRALDVGGGGRLSARPRGGDGGASQRGDAHRAAPALPAAVSSSASRRRFSWSRPTVATARTSPSTTYSSVASPDSGSPSMRTSSQRLA